MARMGKSGSGEVRRGRYGEAWKVKTGQDVAGEPSLGLARAAGPGMARQAWLTWLFRASPVEVRLGRLGGSGRNVAEHVSVWQGRQVLARRGKVRPGGAGAASQVLAGLGKVRPGRRVWASSGSAYLGEASQGRHVWSWKEEVRLVKAWFHPTSSPSF